MGNEINASRRQREAAYEKGEAEKMLKIKASEADAESKRLQGVGMAQMRAAMAQGFKDSITFMKESGMSEQEAMHMMITTQYLDTLKEFAGSHGSIIVPHGPSAVKDIESQIREGFLTAGSVPSQQQMKGRWAAMLGPKTVACGCQKHIRCCTLGIQGASMALA